MSVEELINKLAKQTADIRFEGDGYDRKWVDEATERKLYVNQNFTENIENIKNHGKVLVQSGVYSQKQLDAKYQISKEKYINTVLKETQTLLIILNKNIIPRAFTFLSETVPRNSTSDPTLRRIKKFENWLEKLLLEVENLEKRVGQNAEISLQEAELIRGKLGQIDKITNEVTSYLPESEDWPQLYDILGKY